MNKSFFIKNIFLPFLSCILFSGCATGLVVEGLGAAEVAAIGRSALLVEEYGLAVRGSSLVVAEESLFFSRLRRVRMESPSINKTPRLYITENGNNTYFGIVEKGNEIKLINFLDRTITLPEGSSLFRVKKKANIRVGPGKNYAIYKLNGVDIPPLSENQVILVLRPVGEWYEVQLGKGKDKVGYILASLLVSVAAESDIKNISNAPYNTPDQSKFNFLFDSAVKRFNYLYAADNLYKITSNGPILQDSLTELLKVAIVFENGIRAKTLMARHLYNMAVDYQDSAKKIIGFNTNAVNQRNYYKGLFLKKIDECIPYGEEVINSLENLPNKRHVDKANYRIILSLLIDLYTAKSSLDRVSELKIKLNQASYQ